MKTFARPLLLAALVASIAPAHAAPGDYFGVQVVDESTGRGVPLVELKTTSQQRFVTDSNGFVAVGEPDLMGQPCYFSVSSPGYELGADGFGNRGRAFDLKPGGRGKIALHRHNIAERLYRLTGAGIYRDSVLLGEAVPLARPLLNGGVTGQDTVMAAPYQGKIFWFWGDTNRTSYPLGNFATSGATSPLPQKGELDPAVGVDFTYWADPASGFSRPMLPLPGGGGPVWVGGLFTLGQGAGEELWTHYVHLDGGGQVAEHGLAQWNDGKAIFEKKMSFAGPLFPNHQPLRVTRNGEVWLYFGSESLEAVPLVRVRADRQHVLNPLAYEAFTPLVAGTQKVGEAPALDRDGEGHLRYAWKANTAVLGWSERQKALAAGQIKPDEEAFALRDIESDAPIQSHGGSVHWNPFRGRWIMITTQASGAASYLGEVWFAEADTPVGPWLYARKIASHPKYTFYNPTQHPFFDQQGGRQIYFEGTYTSTYSGTEVPTPRYDYNQLMYRLDLSDARLALPAPVYELKIATGASDYAMREGAAKAARSQIGSAPFFAMPLAASHAGLIPIYRAAPGQLTAQQPAGAKPLFYALPAAAAPGEKVAPSTVPLYEFRDALGGQTRYGTDIASRRAGETVAAPLCRVWRNPSAILCLDFEAQPAP